MKCLLFLLPLIAIASSKLLYLAELFRHGARYPVSDIYDGKDTKPFHGQLTGVGMRQQFLLGSYLKRDYVDSGFLNGTLDASQVEAFTDTSQRCYESAYAHIAGLFGQGQGAVLPQVDAKYLQPPFGSEMHLQADEDGEFALTGGYQPVPIQPGPTYFEECKNEPLLIAERIQVIAPKAAELQA
jgi:hypothetical protein